MDFDDLDQQYSDQCYPDYLSTKSRNLRSFIIVSQIERETAKAYKVIGILNAEFVDDGKRVWNQIPIDRWIPKKALISALEINKEILVKYWLVQFIIDDVNKLPKEETGEISEW